MLQYDYQKNMLDYSGNIYFTTVKNVGPYSYLFGDYIVNCTNFLPWKCTDKKEMKPFLIY
jgi:hypothetical protein